jgi:hypothetical protein
MLTALTRTKRYGAAKALARLDLEIAPGWDGVGDDLLPAALALARERGRIRTCGNPLCRWLFIDRSRNGSRVWCEMAVCGNRMKVGRHRRRPSRGRTVAPGLCRRSPCRSRTFRR